MKTTRILLSAAALSIGLLSAMGAHAALVPALGGQVVNDTDINLTWMFDSNLNITWLADANLAATNTFGLTYGYNYGYDIYGNPSIINSNGTMTWGGALKWIAAMNDANYLGYSDWRLPATIDFGSFGCDWSYGGTDCGYNSTDSEMAHLYYNELGNLGYYSTAGTYQPGYGLANSGPFSNLQSYYYWSGTQSSLFQAWYFNFGVGEQDQGDNSSSFYALAVRPGQVVATPLPGAAWLLGSGLLGLIGLGRRRLALQ